MPPPSSDPSDLSAFERAFEEDRSSGEVHALRHYLAAFPANEAAIARRYLQLTGRRAGEGEVLGHYEVVREIGRGAQGTVYLAKDQHLPRSVALKVLNTSAATLDHAMQRFWREAETTSQLDHPGICQVFDAGVANGRAYIAMQFIDGVTLSKLLSVRCGPGSTTLSRDEASAADIREAIGLSPPDTNGRSRGHLENAVRVIQHAAEALHVAHQAGIVHRDVKPGNIMIRKDGTPVILDFGLASNLQGNTKSVTHLGDLLGTPAYMSPEQLTGQHIHLDGRTDIFSLGATLYECLTQHSPFEAATREALYAAILTKPAIDPRRWNAAIPQDLKVILETSLEKDRDRRYQTAHDFAEDLRRFRNGEPIQARIPGPGLRLARWVKRYPLALAAFALLAGLIATLQVLRQQENRMLSRVRALGLANASAEAMTVDPMRALLLAREAVEIEVLPETISKLHVALAGLHEIAQFRGPGDVVCALLDPNLERVLTISKPAETAIWKVGGEKLDSLPGHSGTILCAAYTSDGTWVATGSEDQAIGIWRTDGSSRRMILGHRGPVRAVAFTPDATHLVSCSDDGTTRVWSLDDDSGRTLDGRWHTPVALSMFLTMANSSSRAGRSDRHVGHQSMAHAAERSFPRGPPILRGSCPVIIASLWLSEVRKLPNPGTDSKSGPWMKATRHG